MADNWIILHACNCNQCYMYCEIFEEYLAGSLAHLQRWWWECWKHHRSVRSGLPSRKSWCPNNLMHNKEIKQYIKKIPGYVINQLSIALSRLYLSTVMLCWGLVCFVLFFLIHIELKNRRDTKNIEKKYYSIYLIQKYSCFIFDPSVFSTHQKPL